MKTSIVFTVVSCVVLGMIGCSGQKTDARASGADAASAAVGVATEMIDSLATGDAAGAAAKFDATMSAAMPPAQLAATWDGLLAQAGGFKQQLKTRTEKTQGFDVVFVTCAFERATLDLQVTVNGSGQVSGFFVRPAA